MNIGWFDYSPTSTGSLTIVEDSFHTTTERIYKIIQKEVEENQISPKQIGIVGFGQGGELALHAAICSDTPLGYCMSVATGLPFKVPKSAYRINPLDRNFDTSMYIVRHLLLYFVLSHSHFVHR